jgi:spore coat protein A
VTLNEGFDEFGRLIQMQGTNVIRAIDPVTEVPDYALAYDDAATETPQAGGTEVWHIVNTTMDTHPIHIHLATAQILSRQPFDVDAFTDPAGAVVGGTRVPVMIGVARGPLATELGWKETFKSNPGEVTTIIMKFDLPKTPFLVPRSPRTGGFEYVWHCHILDHEEHDMMRPLIIRP